MYEITYLVFIKYRGPFGITMTLPKLRTCHAGRRLPALRPFQLEEILHPLNGSKVESSEADQ